MKKNELINIWIKLWIYRVIIDLIISKIADLSKNQLFLMDEIDDKYLVDIESAFNKISLGFPVEYFLENANFYSLDFFVDERVLIPRDDTEVMIDEVLNIFEENHILIDVWTWSSCIPVSILKNVNRFWKCFALDISDKALEISKINIKKHNLQNEINLIKSDLLEYFLINDILLLTKTKLIITANLPYIKDNDFENMDKETLTYEPDSALYWWEKTGFEMYEKLIWQVFEIKKIYKIQKIFLFIEIGFDQKEVSEIFLKKNDLKYKIFKDNLGVDRCVKIEF